GTPGLVPPRVAAAPAHDAGESARLRRTLAARSPWFRALCREGGDRIHRFMTDGDEVDGVRVRVPAPTGRAGDVVPMLPWTMHNLAMNCRPDPRFMVTHSIFRDAG